MKKYIIAFVLFCISLFLIDNAYATDFDGWGMQVIHPSKVVAYNCNASTCPNSISVADNYETDADNNFVYTIRATTPSVTTSTNGIMWIHNVQDILQSGYLYSITGYFCNTGGKNYKLNDIRTANNQANVYNKAYSLNYDGASAVNSISGQMTSNGSSNFTCNYINKIISPSVSSQYVGWQVTTQSSYTGSQYFVGYTIESLGVAGAVTKDDLNGAISNSGLATAQSVDEVKQAEQEIKQEISGMQDKQQETNQKLDNLNDNITNSDSSGATNDASGFFEGFTTDTFGLTSIITAPLNLINNITSSTCTPLTLSLPYINQNVSLPCMTEIYRSYFGSFLTVYQVITFGLVSYWVCVHVFRMVKDFKNPDHDEIEVVDL